MTAHAVIVPEELFFVRAWEVCAHLCVSKNLCTPALSAALIP